MMNPGKLNKKITISKRVSGYDGYGEPIDTKVMVHKCWSSIRNTSGKEQFAATTPYAKVVTSFLIRYAKKVIDTTMTIEFKGEEYDIIYVDNYNFSNEWIEITAEKVA